MTAPTPRDDVDAAAAELLALQHTDHPLPGWDVTCSVCRLTPAEAFRLGYRAAVAAYRAAQDGGVEVARLSPDGELVAIRRGANDWRVSNGGHYRDQHVADWTPLAPQADR